MVYNTGKELKNTIKTVGKGMAQTTPAMVNTVPQGSAVRQTTPTATSGADSSYVPGSSMVPNRTGLAEAKLQARANQLAQQREAARQQYRLSNAMKQNNGVGAYNELTTRLASHTYPNGQAVPQAAPVAPQEAQSAQDTDYAARLYELFAMPQTREVQDEIRRVQAMRNQKIGQNPDTYGQYRGDDVDKAATTAANRIFVDDTARKEGVDSMRANAQGIYDAQKEFALMEFERQAEAARQQYRDLSNQIRYNAARTARGTEETLAAQGLGRGYGRAASSGFGETSRAMANASLNNNLYSAMQNEQSAIQGLQNQYNQNQLQTYMDYANLAVGIDKTGLEQENAYADRKLTADTANAQNAQAGQSLAIEQMRADTDRYSAEKNAEYQQGSLANEQARIALDEKLGIKELEIKEKGIDLQNDQFYASLDLEEKQYALDKWYKENLITVQQYEAESGRIQANATMMNAQTNAQKKTSVGGGGGSYSGGSGASYTSASSGGFNGYNAVETAEKYDKEVARVMSQNPGNPEVARRLIQQWQDSNAISPETADALMRANGLS